MDIPPSVLSSACMEGGKGRGKDGEKEGWAEGCMDRGRYGQGDGWIEGGMGIEWVGQWEGWTEGGIEGGMDRAKD